MEEIYAMASEVKQIFENAAKKQKLNLKEFHLLYVLNLRIMGCFSAKSGTIPGSCDG